MVEQISKYLRKAGTNRIYIWTPQLAERKDMVPHDPELAKIQLEAAKKKRAALQAEIREKASAIKDEDLTTSATELAQVERDIKDLERERDKQYLTSEEAKTETAGETPEEERERIINEDEDIKRIHGMKKDELIEYLALEFGETASEDMKVPELKAFATEKRIARIFEIRE